MQVEVSWDRRKRRGGRFVIYRAGVGSTGQTAGGVVFDSSVREPGEGVPTLTLSCLDPVGLMYAEMELAEDLGSGAGSGLMFSAGAGHVGKPRIRGKYGW